MNDRSTIGHVLHESFPEVSSSNPTSYFGNISDAFTALAHSYLFWPRLFNLYGAVFLALDGDDENAIGARLTAEPKRTPRYAMTWQANVDSYNWFEISSLFRQWRGPASQIDNACEELGRVLTLCWSARLREEFPDRTFSVVLEEPDEYSEWSVAVTQQSPELATPNGWIPELRFISGTDT